MDANKISYIGVKALIVDTDGKVLITQEPTHFVGGGTWELPGGKIAEGEETTSLETILTREIREELGSEFTMTVGPVIDVMRRPWSKPGARADQVFLAVFKCKYEKGEIILSEENPSFAWITKNDLPHYKFVSGYVPVLRKYFESK